MSIPGWVAAGIVACALVAGCGGDDARKKAAEKKAAEAAAATPKAPGEIEAAARAVLGAEAEVLVWGDLAQTGTEQALAIARVPKTPDGAVPGINLLRGAVIEKTGTQWKEIFRADEHLKNAEGYLGGTPLSPVNGWRLQYEQDPKLGLQMYFTPIEQPAGGYRMTIGVRWNPSVKRYQALDRSYVNFQGETKAIDNVKRELRR